MKTTTLTLVLALAALASPAAAGSADDDLAVVKKATGNGQAVIAEAPPRRAGKDDPQWFRVRIVEKGKEKATVKVNLPLALVHAFGDDVPIPGCGENGRADLTLGEVLKALDSGESLVEIDDDDATVRIWVE